MSVRAILERNLKEVRRRISNAADRVNRLPEAVRLVAVTKYAKPEWVRELVHLGMTDLGESRPQQLAQRAVEFSPRVRWHLIGHLQRNKVELVLPHAVMIHSVDSLRLLEAIQKEAEKRQVRPNALLEVNISGEGAKDGFQPEELCREALRLVEFSHVNIVGLMTMAPQCTDPDDARPVFQELRNLRDDLTTLTDGQLCIPQLSMGMSGDFEVAIEEGATLVRIGSSLFEGCEEVDL